MKPFLSILFWAIIIMFFVGGAGATVLTFDDLGFDFTLTGCNYGGIIWETGNNGIYGEKGLWATNANSTFSYPYTKPNVAYNAYGSTLMGIAFSSLTDVEGAYFAAQGHPNVWTTGVKVHGYRNGIEIDATGWFEDIDTTPGWFQMGLMSVDRIVIESVATITTDEPAGAGGWYGMDNFTYSESAPVPEPATMLLFGTGLAGLAGYRRRQAKKK